MGTTMRKSTLLLCFLGVQTLLFAQYEPAVFDYEMAYFNNGQPLPAESMLLFSGEISPSVEAVEVSLFKPNGKQPLYSGLWQRSPGHVGESFQLPVNYFLQGNSRYDLRISYLEVVAEPAKKQFLEDITQKIRAYQLQHIRFESGKAQLDHSGRRMFLDMSRLLKESLRDFRPADPQTEVRFSETIERYLRDLSTESTGVQSEALEKMLEQEVRQLLTGKWMRRSHSREVQDYPSQKKAGALALNLGYGGVLLNADSDNFTYGSAPYIGLSIPLSKRSYGSTLMRNTSISLGAFVSNFEAADKVEFTGPIFGRPFYAGMGYRVFRFIRLNAGLVALEERGLTNGAGEISFDIDRIKLQPFIGLSAEIRLAIGIN